MYGMIGFTLSRGNFIAEGVRSNPHVCQLQNSDQGVDALFFIFDFAKERLNIIRSGEIGDLRICYSLMDCPVLPTVETNATTKNPDGFIKRIWNKIVSPDNAVAMQDYIPLTVNGTKYGTNFSIRFFDDQKGEYQFFYHNCFNYKSTNGYNDLVAVDLTVSIVEMNRYSYLSAGDIIKPQIYFYLAFLFAIASITWMHNLCRSDSMMVFKIHYLMTALVFLKTISIFFHGMNFYYLAVYGRHRAIWAIIYYITHLLKGALLFGTIILIGSGYTLFKNFLSDRDRRIFIIILPLQIIDNIIMAIIEESEFGDKRYFFWAELFMFIDLVCCIALMLPIIGSIRHLEEGAQTDGKAAFNLQKLVLFKHFYVLVICYIYTTRFAKFLLDQTLPFNYGWLSVGVVETATLIFYILVGWKFRPVKQNPYLKLDQDSRDDGDEEDAVALTSNGLYENVSRVQRIQISNETDDIPGLIGGFDSNSDDDGDDQNERATLIKSGREVSIL
uniref:GOST seven transmembrane domain-containing protein n=1 Tax=Panagrolaimus superbus TaxID=310955 RepID=A0A914YJ31_9BILA